MRIGLQGGAVLCTSPAQNDSYRASAPASGLAGSHPILDIRRGKDALKAAEQLSAKVGRLGRLARPQANVRVSTSAL